MGNVCQKKLKMFEWIELIYVMTKMKYFTYVKSWYLINYYTSPAFTLNINNYERCD